MDASSTKEDHLRFPWGSIGITCFQLLEKGFIQENAPISVMPHPLPRVQRDLTNLCRRQCPVYSGKVYCQIRTMFPPTDRGSPTHLYGDWPQCYLIHVTINLTLCWLTFNILARESEYRDWIEVLYVIGCWKKMSMSPGLGGYSLSNPL